MGKIEYIPKSDFEVSKSQMLILSSINEGKQIYLSTDTWHLQYDFYSGSNNDKESKQLMLALLSKRLIRYNQCSLTLELTPLAKRLLELGKTNKSKSIRVTKELIKSTDIKQSSQCQHKRKG